MTRTIEPAYFEFAVNSDDDITEASHVALIAVEEDGTRTAIAIAVPDVDMVSRLLQAHSDAIAQRPIRQ